MIRKRRSQVKERQTGLTSAGTLYPDSTTSSSTIRDKATITGFSL